MKIDLRNLSHSYDVKVLNDINFNLKGYKSVAIIGISGSGKSTLLRLLSGLETPTKGKVFINDSDVLLSSYKKSIGFIFQNHNLFPHLSLLENITIILKKTRGNKKDDAIQIAKKNLDLLNSLISIINPREMFLVDKPKEPQSHEHFHLIQK